MMARTSSSAYGCLLILPPAQRDSGNAVHEAVHVRGGAVLNGQQRVAQPLGNLPGFTVVHEVAAARVLHLTDGGDDRGGAAGKHFTERAVLHVALPVIDADGALFGAV